MKLYHGTLAALIPLIVSCSSNSGSGASCIADSIPCGGNLEGTWNLKQQCIDVDSPSSVTSACSGATAHGSNLVMHGTVTYVADGTYSENITLSGDIVVTIPPSCLTQNGVTMTCAQLNQSMSQQGTPVTCSDANGGGCSCTMPVPAGQTTESGTYTIAGHVLTTAHEGQSDQTDYCVHASQSGGQISSELVLTPHKGSSLGITGIILGTK